MGSIQRREWGEGWGGGRFEGGGCGEGGAFVVFWIECVGLSIKEQLLSLTDSIFRRRINHL